MTEIESSRSGFLQAVEANDRSAVLALLEADPSLTQPDAGDMSPAMLATYYGHGDLARELLARGAPADVFVLAALGLDDRLVAVLDADPAAVHAFSVDGWTALHLAGHFGQTAAAGRLLDRGADPGALSRNRSGNTALHAALAGRRFETARLLVERGADVNAADAEGWTPVHLAAHSGDEDMVRFLLERGASPIAVNANGQIAADLAEQNGHEAVARELRDRDAPLSSAH